MTRTTYFAPPPQRTSRGYRYRNGNFDISWLTSVPQTDEAALAYFAQVAKWNRTPVYVERREAGTDEFEMLPFQFIDGKVVPL